MALGRRRLVCLTLACSFCAAWYLLGSESFEETVVGLSLRLQYNDSIKLQYNDSIVVSTPRPVAISLEQDKYFFFTHHKTGTFLMGHLSAMMGKALNLPRKSGASSHAGTISMLRNCGIRAQDPLKLLSSAYIYHNWSSDTAGMKTGPKFLNKKAVNEGIRYEAHVEAGLDGNPQDTLPEMLSMHEALKKDGRVVTLRLEDVEGEYDESMRKMFTHFIGPDHPSLDSLVEQAAAHDTKRWPPEKLKKDHHVASKEQKTVIKDAIDTLRAEHDPDVDAVVGFRAPMDYKRRI